jgi:hypothetical protein
MVFSQNREDEIIEYIFSKIGTTNKFYVEFGTGPDASECNARNLRENFGWTGVQWDLGAVEGVPGLYKEKIEKDTVLDLFKKYNVPEEFDFISIDIDFNDWHIWREIGKVYRPRVVCIEYNFQWSPYDDMVVPYDPEGGPPIREGILTSYAQGSLLSYCRLAKYLGYKLVMSDDKGINAFFVRNDCTEIPEASIYEIYNKVYKSRLHYDIIGYPNYKRDVKYTSAKELLELPDEDMSDSPYRYIRWCIPTNARGQLDIFGNSL